MALLNAEAEASPGIHACLSEYEQSNGLEVGTVCRSIWPAGNEVVALVLVEAFAVQHSLLPLCAEMKSQFDFWSVLAGSTLESSLRYYRIVKVQMLSLKMSLQETKTGKNTFFFQLNPVWAARLWNCRVIGVGPRELASWMRFSGGRIPELVLRLPKPVVYLLADQQWTRAAVPDAVETVDLVASGWNRRRVVDDAEPALQTFMSLQNSFQDLPAHMHIYKYIQGHAVPDAGQAVTENILGILQTVGAGILQPMHGEGSQKTVLADLLSAAQALQKHALDKRVFVHEAGSLQKFRKYAAVRLVEFFWISGFLQNDRDLKSALRHACGILLPPGAKEETLQFIDGVSESGSYLRIPSAATLSRCRARLDVSWMLLFRKWLTSHLQHQGGAGVSLYVQTDATWQAKQEYQVTVVNVVQKSHLLENHKDRSSSTIQ